MTRLAPLLLLAACKSEPAPRITAEQLVAQNTETTAETDVNPFYNDITFDIQDSVKKACGQRSARGVQVEITESFLKQESNGDFIHFYAYKVEERFENCMNGWVEKNKDNMKIKGFFTERAARTSLRNYHLLVETHIPTETAKSILDTNKVIPSNKPVYWHFLTKEGVAMWRIQYMYMQKFELDHAPFKSSESKAPTKYKDLEGNAILKEELGGEGYLVTKEKYAAVETCRFDIQSEIDTCNERYVPLKIEPVDSVSMWRGEKEITVGPISVTVPSDQVVIDINILSAELDLDGQKIKVATYECNGRGSHRNYVQSLEPLDYGWTLNGRLGTQVEELTQKKAQEFCLDLIR